MQLTIDPDNGLAIYDQIVRQVKYAVAAGVLREGELAPSVRELAKRLTVNPNTVARAYLQLQADEVLESIRGSGLIVRKAAPARCRRERADLIQARLRNVLLEAKQSGLAVDDVRTLVDRELNRLEK